MPISFPANPTANQTFQAGGKTWTYNGKGWLPSTASSGTGTGGAATVTVSNTAPVTTSQGALWINSENLKQYVYITTGNVSYWLEPASSGGGGGSAVVYNTDSNNTGFFSLPRGTTAQRPTSVNDGYMRFNTDLDRVEYYDVTLSRLDHSVGRYQFSHHNESRLLSCGWWRCSRL